MESKTIFELPIYCISEEKYNALSADAAAHDRAIADRLQKPLSQGAIVPPQIPWKFNQIIGYITISVSHDDVVFQLYRCLNKKRILPKSPYKNYIEDCHSTGLHFRAVGMGNDEIRQTIQKYLRSIEKEYLPEKFVVDYSAFNNVFAHTDIAGIMAG